MSDRSHPDIPPQVQPAPEQVAFDLGRALLSIVSIRASVPDDALTAPILGTERDGHGVLIGDDGLVLTIGYLITEADEIWIIDQYGHAVPGHVVGYDQDTGFGLVQSLRPLPLPAMVLGVSERIQPSDPVIVAGYGGVEQAINAHVIAKHEFAGYWEYVLDEAIYTAPSHPNWGGAALIGQHGELLGIGSLLVQHVRQDGDSGDGNMFVPIDLLKPAFNDLVKYGRRNKPARPWIGVLVYEVGDHLVVASVYDDCPAARAGLRVGDVILEVSAEPVSGLADLFRRIWGLGCAGVRVPLTVSREGEELRIGVRSVDRTDCLRTAVIH